MAANDWSQNKAKSIVFIALMAVLMVVCSWISIPFVVPFTMQTFAVYFTLNYLGAKRGTVSIFIYLCLGLLGIPVFSNFNSGIGALLGVTGGYMLGWLFSGLVMWLFEKILGKKIWGQALSMLVALLVCYIVGTAWFMVVYTKNTGLIGVWSALLWCVIPFIVPDLLKLALALWLSNRLKKVRKPV